MALVTSSQSTRALAPCTATFTPVGAATMSSSLMVSDAPAMLTQFCAVVPPTVRELSLASVVLLTALSVTRPVSVVDPAAMVMLVVAPSV